MNSQKLIPLWLYGTCLLILCMIALGGVTRLEGAGLSMVDWRPVTGWLPPLTPKAWAGTFALYQTSPEFNHVNFMFTLQDFKTIFWLEYLHRLLGRLVGLVFLLPGLWFWIRGHLSSRLKKRFLSMLFLGGLQGVMGWYMVKSGLVDQPHVSPYRLAVHLFLALILYGWVFWTALSYSLNPHSLTSLKTPSFVHSLFLWLLILLALTIFYGALVAGLKAGLLYNTFPLMGGHFVPEDWGTHTPWIKDLFENPATVQFIHRWLACSTALLIMAACEVAMRCKNHYLEKKPLIWALRGTQGAVLLQVCLGVATLMHHVPTLLATLHQLGVVLVLSGMLVVLHYTHFPKKTAFKKPRNPV